jgi:nitrite reductase/ring-hydroxylating ferredoxin subunit
MTDDACLRCPRHAALYDAGTGAMVRGPQRSVQAAGGRCDDRRSIAEVPVKVCDGAIWLVG